MSNEQHRRPPSHDWLRRMAAAEDAYLSISVGGLAVDAGFVRSSEAAESRARAVVPAADATSAARVAFARFLDLARRLRGLSLEAVAKEAKVDLAELVRIAEDYAQPSPRTVYQLARILEVPSEKLMELAGLVHPREEVAEAAVRFAARSEPTVQLSEEERVALEEFVKVLVESTDNG